MVELRLSRKEEAGAQKELWKEAFGDTDEDIELFYGQCWRPSETLLLLEDGHLACMTALLPHTLSGAGGETLSACYVYALATAKALRGRGHAKRLLAAADDLLQKRGVDCATVVPAQASLHRFFEASGFQPCFCTQRSVLSPGGIPAPAPADRLAEVGPREYAALRSRCLEGVPAARYPLRLLEFQLGMCRLSGGGLYRLDVEGASGCAAAEYREERLVLKELLLPCRGRLARALALLAQALPAGSYEVRGPAGRQELGGEIWEFGRIKWYHPDKAARFGRRGYFGLGFD
mgnify:CR=1 FL=1